MGTAAQPACAPCLRPPLLPPPTPPHQAWCPSPSLAGGSGHCWLLHCCRHRQRLRRRQRPRRRRRPAPHPAHCAAAGVAAHRCRRPGPVQRLLLLAWQPGACPESRERREGGGGEAGGGHGEGQRGTPASKQASKQHKCGGALTAACTAARLLHPYSSSLLLASVLLPPAQSMCCGPCCGTQAWRSPVTCLPPPPACPSPSSAHLSQVS